MPPTARPRERRRFRPEIQGLRAVAVLLVVGYHLAPERLTGGYVGVDVFFAISGFLITGQIVDEAVLGRRLSLSGFWGRRIRRLLPAALLVLAASLLATWIFLPTTLWADAIRHIAASALYVENWALARDAVDYLARDDAPSIVQHYWSLSVEEQFYVLWPLLVVLVLLLGRVGGSSRSPRPALAVALAAVTVASLVLSLVQTTTDPGIAYFSTFTRIWEFGAGGLLAVAGPLVTSRVVRYALGWGGLLAIAGAAVLFDPATPFPGFAAALPVGGAVAVIAAGGSELRASAARVLALRPAVFVGDISYAVYLWHWPLIVVAPFVIGAPLAAPAKAALVALTLGLAWLTTRLIEDPVRRLAPLARPVWRTFVAGATAMALVLSGAAAVSADLDRRLGAAEAAQLQAQRTAEQVAADTLADVVAGSRARGCVGPAALDPVNGCAAVEGVDEVLVPPALVGAETFEALYPGCMFSQDVDEVPLCELGDTASPAHTIAVVGDSHATHWLGAFDLLGRSLGWRVLAGTKASCPFTAAERGLADEPADHAVLCRASNDRLLDVLIGRGDVEAVFLSAFGSAYTWEGDLADGIRASAGPLEAVGIPVVVLRDVPLVKDRTSSPACLEAVADPRACGLPRAEALVPDPYAEAAAAIGLPVLDLSDSFCDATWCHAVVGGVVVYVDYSHLSREYSTLLAAPVHRALVESGVPIPD